MACGTYQLVPHPRRLDVLGSADTDFLVVPHRKLGAGQAFACGFLCKREREVLVFVKGTFSATQEPLAERHVGLDLTLLTREGVILDAQEGIERERRQCKLVRMSEFVLRRGEMQKRGPFQMKTRFLFCRRMGWNEGRKYMGRNGDMGELSEEKQSIDIRGLGDLHRCEGGSTVNQGETDVGLCREAELTHQVCHAHTLNIT